MTSQFPSSRRLKKAKGRDSHRRSFRLGHPNSVTSIPSRLIYECNIDSSLAPFVISLFLRNIVDVNYDKLKINIKERKNYVVLNFFGYLKLVLRFHTYVFALRSHPSQRHLNVQKDARNTTYGVLFASYNIKSKNNIIFKRQFYPHGLNLRIN
ncbi:hypothetical protein V1478_000319 [Vespula squamosa]|uniref:Uncharacterized protein n=1 Tax=Vespula squamosa TaxID=30214 RepID=A0ABD2C778_VESSQ